MKSDTLYIAQICDAIGKIHSFVAEMTRSDFLADQKTQSAVLMQLALIGELAKRISEETKEMIALPWRDIAGFRDRAIHDYFSIDLEVVWTTIVEDIPVLEEKLSDVAL